MATTTTKASIKINGKRMPLEVPDNVDPNVANRAADVMQIIYNNEKKLLNEAAMDFFQVLNSGYDVYDLMQEMAPDSWYTYPYYIPPIYRQSQKRGEVLPIYLDEVQLRFLRDRSRKLWAENPFCTAAIENRKNYIVGAKGLTKKAIKGHPDCPDKLVRMTQRILDRWNEYNEMWDFEKNIMVMEMSTGKISSETSLTKMLDCWSTSP